MIYHIYWGTSGSSGLYLDEIYQVLKRSGINQRVFVNYYYPFDYGDKIFLKRGDVSLSKYKSGLRRLIQLQEIIIGYYKIIIASIKDKPQIINYNHVGQSYCFIYWFLKIIKKYSCAKLMITCHDVKPHYDGVNEMNNRNKIFNLADFLLVHTNQSIDDMIEFFSIDRSKIYIHPFPIMDISKIIKSRYNPYSKTDFLFIGHLRRDKGIEFLLESWPDFHRICPDAKLRVCGRYLPEININQEYLEKCNVEFDLKYVSDEDFYHYVMATRYVILPYLQGTNSGIISTIISLGTNILTSDLPVFAQNPMVKQDNMFVTGNSNSLINLLIRKWGENDSFDVQKLSDYKSIFTSNVIATYTSIINSVDGSIR